MTYRKPFVLLYGANVRQSLAQAYNQFGPDAGFQCGERALWDMADYMADMHGSKEAYAVIQNVADCVARRVFTDMPVPILPSAQQTEPEEPTPDEPVVARRLVVREHISREHVEAAGMLFVIFLALMVFALMVVYG